MVTGQHDRQAEPATDHNPQIPHVAPRMAACKPTITWLEPLMTEHAIDPADLHALQSEVAALRDDVRELIDAWKAAKGLVRLVKFIAALAVAYAAVWSAFRIGGK